MKVLVVEDDLITRKAMQKYISPYGKVDIAGDGEEAFAAFSRALRENKPYDLVCLDIKLPKLNGQEFLKRIRKTEEELKIGEKLKVKIIMTSVLADPDNVFKAFYKGKAASYLVKPFTEEEIVSEIRKLGLL
jgi:two-component system chemotaxis response regulator CheY